MKSVALVTPIGPSPTSNPGSHIITAGIRALLRKVISNVSFVPVDMMADNVDHWSAAMLSDLVVVCGNPRYSMADEPCWLDEGLWSRFEDCLNAGIPIIDAWAGACYPYDTEKTLDEKMAALLSQPRNIRNLQDAKRFRTNIARDSLLKQMFDAMGTPSTLLPCSSWWAAEEYGIKRTWHSDFDVVVLLSMEGHCWAPDAVKALIAAMNNAVVVAPMLADYLWARENGIDAELMSDPASQLRLYAHANRVASFRIHAAIPAASLGCEVCCISIDSRTLTAEEFGIPSVPMEFLQNSSALPFSRANPPDEMSVLKVLQEIVQ